MDKTIEIARDFSRYPGPRYKNDGNFSGQVFRDDVLAPALKTALNDGTKITVYLDDVAGYGSSFLEESFGGLIRHGFTKDELDRSLVIAARTDRFRHHVVRALDYISDEAARTHNELAFH